MRTVIKPLFNSADDYSSFKTAMKRLAREDPDSPVFDWIAEDPELAKVYTYMDKAGVNPYLKNSKEVLRRAKKFDCK